MSEALFRALGGHDSDGGHGSSGEADDDDDGPDIARVTRWTYDPAGNRIAESKDGRVTASTYSPANELLTSGPWRFESDLRGNQISRQKGSDTKERFVYNVANMLMSYGRERRSGHGGGNNDGGHGNDDDDDGQPGPAPGGPPIVDEIERYFYAPSFERLSLQDAGTGELTNFLWRDGRPIEEFVRKAGKKEDTARGTRYSWAMGQLLEQQSVDFRAKIQKASMDFLLGEAGVAGKDRDFGLTDHLASLRLLTDDKGKAQERTTWGPWGELLSGGQKSRIGFTGHQTDARTGLRYAVHRYLDPNSGRWSQHDPIGFAGGQANLLEYVANSPVINTDPSGLALPVIAAVLLEAAYTGAVLLGEGLLVYAGLATWAGATDYVVEASIQKAADPSAPVAIDPSRFAQNIEQAAAIGQLPLAYGSVFNNVFSRSQAALRAGLGPRVPLGNPWEAPASPSYQQLRDCQLSDSHHIIQHETVRRLPGVEYGEAPAEYLRGPTRRGTPHNLANNVQRLPGGGTYGAERDIAYDALRAAGLSHEQAVASVQRADSYFMTILGYELETTTTIPANRR